MTHANWGLLGPESLPVLRRTRTLGLGAAVRTCNELAVPGIGNVFFGKQLLLALLGIRVAEQLRESDVPARNIETANAVEALACWLALNENGWQRDPRLRGATKMRNYQDITFASAKNRNFYVVQPMRMATGEALFNLGLVEAPTMRFNSFASTPFGCSLIDAFCDAYPPTFHKKKVLEHLVRWAKGNNSGFGRLTEALSPLQPLPLETREALHMALLSGTDPLSARRRAALAWVARLARTARTARTATTDPAQAEWTHKPPELDEEHWQDLHAGALFFAVRDAALDILDRLEAHLRTQTPQEIRLGDSLNTMLGPFLDVLRQRANAFLAHNHDPSPEGQAGIFCRECLDEPRSVEHLVLRDDRVVRLRHGKVVPGPAFPPHGTAGVVADNADDDATEEQDSEVPAADGMGLPERISHRVRNLFLLHLDLEASLDTWLGGAR